MSKIGETIVPPREARAFDVPAGHIFRIVSVEGPQVGDLNLWNAANLSERFFSGKTRALHATHVSAGDRLWSALPYLRPMATITHDTLDWYGFDADGAGVHDVIGTRCDPYTNRLLTGVDYHHCCHSNLTRALAASAEAVVRRGRASRSRRAERLHVHRLHPRRAPLLHEGEPGSARRLHRVLRRDRPDRRALGLPGGDCGASHSSDEARCHPLMVEIYRPRADALRDWRPPPVSLYPVEGDPDDPQI